MGGRGKGGGNYTTSDIGFITIVSMLEMRKIRCSLLNKEIEYLYFLLMVYQYDELLRLCMMYKLLSY